MKAVLNYPWQNGVFSPKYIRVNQWDLWSLRGWTKEYKKIIFRVFHPTSNMAMRHISTHTTYIASTQKSTSNAEEKSGYNAYCLSWKSLYHWSVLDAFPIVNLLTCRRILNLFSPCIKSCWSEEDCVQSWLFLLIRSVFWIKCVTWQMCTWQYLCKSLYVWFYVSKARQREKESVLTP